MPTVLFAHFLTAHCTLWLQSLQATKDIAIVCTQNFKWR